MHCWRWVAGYTDVKGSILRSSFHRRPCMDALQKAVKAVAPIYLRYSVLIATLPLVCVALFASSCSECCRLAAMLLPSPLTSSWEPLSQTLPSSVRTRPSEQGRGRQSRAGRELARGGGWLRWIG